MEAVSELKGCVYIGTAGWNYPDWKGIFFPSRMNRGLDPLTYLAEYFNTVEINASFYRPPKAEHAARWVRLVEKAEDFSFTVKLWRRFTHDRDHPPTLNEAELFREGLKPLEESGRLGGLLVQFPWSFRYNEKNRIWLERILDLFSSFSLILEVRHAGWNRQEVYDFLRQRKVAICNIDQPLYPDSIAPGSRITSEVGYIRLHGQNHADWFRKGAGRDARYDYLYSEKELSPWIEKILKIRDQVDRLYVVTNNHYRGQAAVNGLQIAHRVRGKKIKVPSTLLNAYPQLSRISKDPGPGTQGRLPGF